MARPARSAALLLLLLVATPVVAADWSRFRGDGGLGVAQGPTPPTTWSETENLKWSVDLPGPGLSSPIVVGDQVFVTCWTGYGADGDDQGDQADLKRLLVSVDRQTGAIQWTAAVDAALPEDEYRGMFAENGYASHTPVCDGERVYCFFGKSGVVAFTMDGKKLWQTPVGEGLDPRAWGSASSPILYKDKVIVVATAESNAVVALDKATGKEAWRQQVEGLEGVWSTPVLVEVDGERTDLVLAVPREVWGLNPDTGKTRWFCNGADSDSACPSVLVVDGVGYFMDGRGGSLAVRMGGKGDVSETHEEWRNNARGSIATPVYHNGKLYQVGRGVVTALDAATGDEAAQFRLEGASGGGGDFRRQSYASPVLAGDMLYYVSRSGESFVLDLSGDEPKQVAMNKFASDEGDFNATPAISDGQLFIRSTKKLYCVAAGE